MNVNAYEYTSLAMRGAPCVFLLLTCVLACVFHFNGLYVLSICTHRRIHISIICIYVRLYMNICMRINMRGMLLGEVQRRTLLVPFACVCARAFRLRSCICSFILRVYANMYECIHIYGCIYTYTHLHLYKYVHIHEEHAGWRRAAHLALFFFFIYECVRVLHK